MKFTWIGVAAVLAIALSTGAGVARADTLSGCGDCGGGVYTLTYNPTPLASDATTNTFAVTLTVDSSAYTGSSSAFVDAIGLTLNLAGGSNVPFSSAVLVSAPGGAAEWNQPIFGGISNGSTGCSGSGTAFFCTDLNDAFETSALAPSKVGGTQSWTWDVTISNTDSLVTTPSGDDLKLIYVTAPDTFDGVQVSDSIGLSGPPTPTPEPGSLALLGTGLLGLAPFIRRKLSA